MVQIELKINTGCIRQPQKTTKPSLGPNSKNMTSLAGVIGWCHLFCLLLLFLHLISQQGAFLL